MGESLSNSNFPKGNGVGLDIQASKMYCKTGSEVESPRFKK